VCVWGVCVVCVCVVCVCVWCVCVCVCRDNSVGIATSYGLDSRDRIPVAARFSTPVQTGPEAHPAFYTKGTGSFPRVKRLGRGVDHPPHLARRLKKV